MISIPEKWLPRWRSTAQRKALCWKIVRTDGTALRFTSWDQPIMLGSETFLPRDDSASSFDEAGGGQVTGDTRQSSFKEHSAGLSGLISSDSINEDDLRAGLYQNATVYTYLLDAGNPSAGYIRRTFKVADVQWTTDGAWKLSVVSAIDSALQNKRGEVVSRTCRNSLFGARCARARTPGGSDGLVADQWEIGQTSGNFCTVSAVTDAFNIRVQIPAITIGSINTGSAVPDTTYFTTATNHYFVGQSPSAGDSLKFPMLVYGNVGSSPDFNGTWEAVTTETVNPDQTLIVSGIDVTTAGSTLGFVCLAPYEDWFTRGKLTWQTGDNSTQEVRIAGSSAFVASPTTGFGGYVDIELDAAPVADVQVGDTCSIRVGCDLTSQTCQSRFDNIVNFNGEPFTPTADILLNTPSAN